MTNSFKHCYTTAAEEKDIITKDTLGNVIHVESIGKYPREYWIEYEENSHKPIHYYSTYGYEWWITYTKKGNISHFWDNEDYWEDYCYYRGNHVIMTDSFGTKINKVIKSSNITRDKFFKQDYPIGIQSI